MVKVKTDVGVSYCLIWDCMINPDEGFEVFRLYKLNTGKNSLGFNISFNETKMLGLSLEHQGRETEFENMNTKLIFKE